MILMKVVVVSINVANENKEYARNLPHPVEEPVGGIAACKRAKDCLAFVYTPAPKDEHVPSAEVSDADFAESMGTVEKDAVRRVDRLVRNVLQNNKGGGLDPSQVMGFTSEQAIDEFVTRGDMLGKVDVGVIFQSPSAAATTFILQCNTTKITIVENKLVPMQVALTRAIAEELDAKVTLDISLQPFAHPKLKGEEPIDAQVQSAAVLCSCARAHTHASVRAHADSACERMPSDERHFQGVNVKTMMQPPRSLLALGSSFAPLKWMTVTLRAGNATALLAHGFHVHLHRSDV